MTAKEIFSHIVHDCERLAKDPLTAEVTRSGALIMINAHKDQFHKNLLGNKEICGAIIDLYWECTRLIKLQPKLKTKFRVIPERMSEAKEYVIDSIGAKEWFLSDRSVDKSKPRGWIDL